jgi:Bax protein
MVTNALRVARLGREPFRIGALALICAAAASSVFANDNVPSNATDPAPVVAANLGTGVITTPPAALVAPAEPDPLRRAIELSVTAIPDGWQAPPVDLGPDIILDTESEQPAFAATGGGQHRSFLNRIVFRHKVASTGHLESVLRAHDFSLTAARQGEPVPALRFDRMPDDFGQAREGRERVELFIKTVLPLVLQTNEAILADREELLRLRDERAAGREWNAVERSWVAELADRYSCESDNLDELVRRVDAVPPSMALAQGGVESGWGTSYAARFGNALFGQIQATGRHTVAAPWRPGPAMPQPFASIGESVEAYILNLNSHPAYAAFRADRAGLRTQGQALDGHRLVGHLLRYSERGQAYIVFVRQIMRENRMSELDNARLPPL